MIKKFSEEILNKIQSQFDKKQQVEKELQILTLLKNKPSEVIELRSILEHVLDT